jgi:hypothetical protein
MTTDNQQINMESDEISLKGIIFKILKLWEYLLSRWLVVLLFGLLGAALGFTYAFFSKTVYTATTTFVLDDEKGSGGLGNLAGLASMAGVDLGGAGGGIFQGDNILGLYKSRTMLQQTLLTSVNIGEKKELLVDRYIAFNILNGSWSDKSEIKALPFLVDTLNERNQYLKPNRLRDSILGVIVLDLNRNYLTVAKPDKKLSTIQVDVKAKDEFFAKAFNDALVKNVNEFYINTKTKKTLKNVQILQHKTDSVKRVMNGAIYTAVAVGDATPNLNPTRQVQRVAPAQKAQFSTETNKAILAEMVKNLEMTKMSLLRETPLIQVVDQPIYPLSKQRIGRIKASLLGCFAAIGLITFILLFRKFLKGVLNSSSIHKSSTAHF